MAFMIEGVSVVKVVVRQARFGIIVAVLLVLNSAGWSTMQAAELVASVTRVMAAETAREIWVSIEASAPIRYQIRDVQSDWIVVDVLRAQLAIQGGTLPIARSTPEGLVRRLRVGQFQPDIVRVVLELARPMKFSITPSADRTALVVGIPTAAAEAVAPQSAAVKPGRPEAGFRFPGSASPTAAVQAEGRALPKPRPKTPSRSWSIEPGHAIGTMQLGMRVQDAVAALGPAVGKQTLPDGSVIYQWFRPPKNSGLGARVTPAGLIYRIWALNDDRYVVKGRIHAGSTEGEVRTALGDPTRVAIDSRLRIRMLIYEAQGVWISIQLNPQYRFYNTVFEIGVMRPTASRPPQ
jgi:hypothetical protein